MTKRHVMIEVEAQGLPHDKPHASLHKGHVVAESPKPSEAPAAQSVEITLDINVKVDGDPKELAEKLKETTKKTGRFQKKTDVI